MLKKLLYSLVIIFLLFLGLSRVLNIGDGVLERAVSYALYPFLVMQKSVRVRFAQWRLHHQSVEELLSQLEYYLQLHEKLQQEVIELKSFVNFKASTQELKDFLVRYKTDAAHLTHVILKHFDKNHFFLVDAGTNKGITKDLIAVYKDCLVGRVIEVYPYYSKVILLTDPTCKVAALCTSTNVKGIHEGGRLESTKLSFVDHLQDLKQDDLIISSGEGPIFPRGFGLGRIKHWERDGYTCTVTIEPLLDLKKIEYCYLMHGQTALLDTPATAQNAL